MQKVYFVRQLKRNTDEKIIAGTGGGGIAPLGPLLLGPHMPNKSLNMNTYWSNIKIGSCFSFWKLDYFTDMRLFKNIVDTRKLLVDKSFMFFLNPANHIKIYSVILKSDMEPGYILLKIKPISIREIPTRAFPVSVFDIVERVWVIKLQ